MTRYNLNTMTGYNLNTPELIKAIKYALSTPLDKIRHQLNRVLIQPDKDRLLVYGTDCFVMTRKPVSIEGDDSTEGIPEEGVVFEKIELKEFMKTLRANITTPTVLQIDGEYAFLDSGRESIVGRARCPKDGPALYPNAKSLPWPKVEYGVTVVTSRFKDFLKRAKQEKLYAIKLTGSPEGLTLSTESDDVFDKTGYKCPKPFEAVVATEHLIVALKNIRLSTFTLYAVDSGPCISIDDEILIIKNPILRWK